MAEDQYLLSSVDNTLKLLDLLSQQDKLGVAEISAMLKMSKASVFRMLYTLERHGYLYKTRDAKYGLGMKFAAYGEIVLERMDLIAMVKPYLQELCDRHNETTHMAILAEDYGIMFITKVLGTNSMQMNSRIGARFPAYFTGSGKALMAHLPLEERIRAANSFHYERRTENTLSGPEALLAELEVVSRQGFAEDREESEVGLTCFAVPITGITGIHDFSISISGPSQRMENNKPALIQSLLKTAETIRQSLKG